MQDEGRGNKRSGSTSSDAPSKKKRKVSIESSKDYLIGNQHEKTNSSELPFHGEKWHHHHRYETRLQEVIEGPGNEIDAATPAKGNSAEVVRVAEPRPKQPMKKVDPTPLQAHVISPPQASQETSNENETTLLSTMIADPAVHATPTNISQLTARNLENMDHAPQRDSKKRGIVKIIFLALLFFAAGFTVAAKFPSKNDFFHRRKQGALESKLSLCREIQSEFARGPVGFMIDNHALFHPPLDTILAESTARQVAWLSRVQAARIKVSPLQAQRSMQSLAQPYISRILKSIENHNHFLENQKFMQTTKAYLEQRLVPSKAKSYLEQRFAPSKALVAMELSPPSD